MMEQACYPSTGETEAREMPLVQGQHVLHGELQVNIVIRCYLKKKK